MWFFKPKNRKCSNGGAIQWFSKETIMFTNKDYCVEVWVDYKDEAGEGRVIYKSGIKEWTNRPPNTNATVPDNEKERIVKCIIEFLTNQGINDIAINE